MGRLGLRIKHMFTGHPWRLVEIELGGRWATPGRKRYECECGAAKFTDKKGR